MTTQYRTGWVPPTPAQQIRALLVGAFVALVACVHVPTPPDGSPPDVFQGATYDCHTAAVAIERDSVRLDSGPCLTVGDATACLVKLAAPVGQYSPASVACAARDNGARANASFLDGNNPADEAAANAARAFIVSHQLGFK